MVANKGDGAKEIRSIRLLAPRKKANSALEIQVKPIGQIIRLCPLNWRAEIDPVTRIVELSGSASFEQISISMVE